MVKIISTVALVLMLILLPPSVAMAASNNAIPGQIMYPVKMAMEGVVLFFASLTPYSKAFFALAQNERRYKEAATLISQGTDAQKSLDALLEQTKKSAENIEQLNDDKQKVALIKDLSDSIDKYSEGLKEAGDNFESSQPVVKVEEPFTSPSVKPSSTPVVLPKPSGKLQTQVPTPTPTPKSFQPGQNQYQPDPQLEAQRKAIEEARRQLEEYKRYLEMLRQQTQSKSATPPPPPPAQIIKNNTATPTPSPSLKPSPSPSPLPSPVASPSPSSAGIHSASLDYQNNDVNTAATGGVTEENEAENEYETPSPSAYSTQTALPAATATPQPSPSKRGNQWGIYK